MSKLNNLTGQIFGRLTALRRLENDKSGKTKWLCSCSCGNEKPALATNLLRGLTTSCGCLHKEVASFSKRTHGGRKLPEYIVWARMRSRCTKPTDKSYARYGGRGIFICERWSFFENFIADMGPRPSNHHSIDRIDNNGPYSPENCRWTTAEVQANNRRARSNIAVTEYLGEVKTLREWSVSLGVNLKTLHWRFAQGWRGDKLFHIKQVQGCRNTKSPHPA